MTKPVQSSLKSENSNGSENVLTSRCKGAMVILFSAFLISSLLSTPEGAIREGDYLPLVFVFLILSATTFVARLTISLFSKNAFPPEAITHGALSSSPTNRRHSWRSKLSLPVIADSSIILFLILISASCARVVLQHSGDVRFAINGLWTTATPALAYLFLRFFKFFTSDKNLRVFLLIVATCVMTESLFSLFSYTVLDPQKRAEYLANPDKLLMENGLSLPAGSRERELFENRLLSSVEPIGTYGLTNTLAAFLLPALVIALLGIPWARLIHSPLSANQLFPMTRNNPPPHLSQIILTAILLSFVGIVIYVFLLTKSRTAFISLIFSLLIGLIIKISRGQNAYFSWKYLLLLLIPLSLAFVTKGLDLPVITESFKSLSYRFEYWEATLDILNSSPLLGIGPGEFQNVYPRYILPEASEFVADPHNFVLEVGSLYGLPALACLLVFFLTTCICAFIPPLRTPNEDLLMESPSKERCPRTSNMAASVISSPRSSYTRLTFIFGASLGIFMTFLCSGFQSSPVALEMYPFAILAILSFFFATYLLRFSPKEVIKNTKDVIPSWILGTSLFVSLLNLLGSGGINYPPISILLFFSSAVLINRKSLNERGVDSTKTDASSRRKPIRSLQYLFILVFSIGLVFLFKTTALSPRNRSFTFEQLCFQEPAAFFSMMNRYSPEEIDKYSSFVALHYYFKAASDYSQKPNERNRLKWNEAGNYLKVASPNSPSLRESCALYDKQLFDNNPKRVEFLDSAINFYYESIDRSPTDANKHANLAQLLLRAKREKEAMEQIDKALFYDDTTTHKDRKIPPEIRIEFQTLKSRLQGVI